MAEKPKVKKTMEVDPSLSGLDNLKELIIISTDFTSRGIGKGEINLSPPQKDGEEKDYSTFKTLETLNQALVDNTKVIVSSSTDGFVPMEFTYYRLDLATQIRINGGEGEKLTLTRVEDYSDDLVKNILKNYVTLIEGDYTITKDEDNSQVKVKARDGSYVYLGEVVFPIEIGRVEVLAPVEREDDPLPEGVSPLFWGEYWDARETPVRTLFGTNSPINFSGGDGSGFWIDGDPLPRITGDGSTQGGGEDGSSHEDSDEDEGIELGGIDEGDTYNDIRPVRKSPIDHFDPMGSTGKNKDGSPIDGWTWSKDGASSWSHLNTSSPDTPIIIPNHSPPSSSPHSHNGGTFRPFIPSYSASADEGVVSPKSTLEANTPEGSVEPLSTSVAAPTWVDDFLFNPWTGDYYEWNRGLKVYEYEHKKGYCRFYQMTRAQQEKKFRWVLEGFNRDISKVDLGSSDPDPWNGQTPPYLYNYIALTNAPAPDYLN